MSSNPRRQTKRICCVITACLLFMQLAVAAYACPRLDVPNIVPAAITAEPSDMAKGCEVLDPANPNLCLQQLQAGTQLPDTAALPIPVPSAGAVLEIALPAPAGNSNSFIAVARDLLARDTAPPLTVRNCCFRI